MKLNYKDIIDKPIDINKNTLSVGDNLYSFDNTIESIIVMDSRIIVLLKYSNEKDIRNIFCVDHMCDLLWRIEDIRKVYPKLSHDPYVGITKSEITIADNNIIISILCIKNGTHHNLGTYLVFIGLYNPHKDIIILFP